MNVTLHHAADTHFWPLHQESPVGEQLVAGKRLADLQSIQAEGIAHPHQLDASWVEHKDWLKLAAEPLPSRLISVSGEVLAWTGAACPDETVGEIRASEHSFSIRYPWDFLRLNEWLVSRITSSEINGEVRQAVYMDGHVQIGEDSIILPGVYFEGNAVIGRKCKIGPNCYIRGSTTVGDGCRIGQAVEIKNSIIGHGTSIGHLSYVGDSIIGQSVNFGAGTVAANLRLDGANNASTIDGELVDTGRRKFGAVVGDCAKTGVHTMIYPGRKLASGSYTSPGTAVKKDLTS